MSGDQAFGKVSPLPDGTVGTQRLLLDISRASTDPDPISCLITRLPFAVGTVKISHLVDTETPATNLNRLRKWWGHENFRVNSALNLITLDTHFHSGFDKSLNPLWTIIPTDEVVDAIKLFADEATDMTTEDRKAMYDKYDVRLTGHLNTYRFVPLRMLHGENPFYRRRSTLPADDAIWDHHIPLRDRLDRSAIESALDKMIPICYPFRDPCLQELKSHVHPFCVIVKAAPALATYRLLVPHELRRVSDKVRLVASQWSSHFPSTPHLSTPSSSRSSSYISHCGLVDQSMSPLCDLTGSPEPEHEDSGGNILDSLRLIQKIKPWRDNMNDVRTASMPLPS